MNKVGNSVEKELDCEPIYNKKFLKTKIGFNSDETIDFHTRKIPEGGSNYICWSVILINSVLEKDENYLQVSLKECKCIKKRKKGD